MAMFGGASFTGDYQADHGNAGAKAAFDKAFATGSRRRRQPAAERLNDAELSWLNRSGGQTINGGLPGGRSRRQGLPSPRSTWTPTATSTRPGRSAAAQVRVPAGETEIAGNVKKNDEGWA